MVLVPVGGVRRGSSDHHLGLWAWYHDEDDALLAPLYYEHSGEDGSDRGLLTWRERRSERASVSAVYPFYADTRERLGGQRERHQLTALWPVHRREVVRSSSGERESRSRRFLIFSDEQRADGVRRFTLFGIPISETVEASS